MGALQLMTRGLGVALALVVSAIVLVPTAASAETHELTNEQIDELESWCRANGGTATTRVSESGVQFNCFLPDGTWIACGILWGQATWGCIRLEPSRPPTTPDEELVTSGPAGLLTTGTVGDVPTASASQLSVSTGVLK